MPSPTRSPRSSPRAATLLLLAACAPATPVAPVTPATPPISSAPLTNRASAPRDADAAAAAAAPDAPPPADARGKVVITVADECGFILDQLYFAPSSSSLRPAQRPILDATADMFRCFQRTGEVTKWQVVGNADATERSPASLSLARARAVADALVARGVDATTLDLVGAGATQPQDRHRTPAALAKNRRVFFLVLQRRAPTP
jgi:outer membrane protein OmpA-like peptidoglycan-associated protein